MPLPPPGGQGKVQARHNGYEQQLPARKAGVPGQRIGRKKAHDQLQFFERQQANKRGKTTGVGATHRRSVCRKRGMVWQSHLLMLRQNTQRQVVGVPEGIKQIKVEDSGYGRIGAFRSQNEKEV